MQTECFYLSYSRTQTFVLETDVEVIIKLFPFHLIYLFLFFFPQGLYLEITLREVVFNELLKLGREVLEKTEPGPNREDLQKNLNNVENRWTDVFYNTIERQEKLEEIVPLAQKYTDSVSDLLPWLTETEQMVADSRATIVCEKHALIREQTFIKVGVLWLGFCKRKSFEKIAIV